MLERIDPELAIVEEVPEVLNAAHLEAQICVVTLFALEYFHHTLHQVVLHSRVCLHGLKVR